MNKKEIATQFLKMAGSGDVRSAYERFIAKNFIHHNQYFKGDRQSLMTAMEEAHKSSPNKSIDIKFTYEDNDTVITHSLVTRKGSDQPDIVVVHIFKFEGSKVVELWDLGQMLDKNSPNENGAF